MTPLVEIERLAVRYVGASVLRDVSLSVAPGEIVTIVGPNGSGKSTLLRTIIGAVAPAAGSVRRAEGLRIGYVPQRMALDPSLPLTARRFLSLPRRGGPSATLRLCNPKRPPHLPRPASGVATRLRACRPRAPVRSAARRSRRRWRSEAS